MKRGRQAGQDAGLRAVLFDLDGVLVDSLAAWESLLLEAVGHFAGRRPQPGEFRACFGQSTAADCAAFLPGVAPADLDGYYRRRFAAHAGRVQVMPAAAETLDGLRARGLRLGCVTNTPAVIARGILAAAELAARLDAVIAADEVAAAKPAPDVVLAALARLAVTAGQAVLVGDSRFDVLAARASGVRSIGVGVDLGADRHIAGLAELEDALADLARPATGG